MGASDSRERGDCFHPVQVAQTFGLFGVEPPGDEHFTAFDVSSSTWRSVLMILSVSLWAFESLTFSSPGPELLGAEHSRVFLILDLLGGLLLEFYNFNLNYFFLNYFFS